MLGAIKKVVAAADIAHITFEIIVFDDGSTDRTAEVVNEYSREHPDIALQLVRNPRRRGIAKNFVEGAFRVSGRYYRTVTGDDTEPLETHVAIFRAVGTADILLPVQVVVEGKGFARMFLSRLYTSLVNLLSGNRVGYYNGGPVLLREDVLRYHVDAIGVAYLAELVTRLISAGREYRELFVIASHRERSAALTFMNVLSATHSLVRIARRRFEL